MLCVPETGILNTVAMNNHTLDPAGNIAQPANLFIYYIYYITVVPSVL